jgi:hypothetical protein
MVPEFMPPSILRKVRSFSLILPANHVSLVVGNQEDIGGYMAPFFYHDRQNTFFVEPSLIEITSQKYDDWVLSILPPAEKPDEGWKRLAVQAFIPQPLSDPGDPYARFEIGPQEDWVTNQAATVEFGDRRVRSDGGIDVATRSAAHPAGNPAIH